MTVTAGWLLLAAAVLAWAAPSLALERTDRLVGTARLARAPSVPSRVGLVRARVATLLPALGVAVVLTVGATLGLAAAVALAAVGGCGGLLIRDAMAGRAARAAAADLAVGVDVIVGELEAGAQPGTALLAAADSSSRHDALFRTAGAAAVAGGDASEVLLADPRTVAIGVAWRVGQDGGTALAGVLRRVGADLRAAADQRRTVQVALSGPRSSARLLTGLPLLGIGLGVAMGAQPFAFLLGSPTGRVVGCIGVLLDVAGVLWMRRILRRAGGP